MRWIAQLLGLLMFFTLLVNSSEAQNKRPKVGLVLSGGGAKGMSHIGILKAIDSAGLKIDIVTGTSMGSIMGALYAVGYSGKQIDSIAKTLNWDVLLSNKPQYSDIGIDEKDEFARYAIELGLEKFKPQIGTGLIESEEMWLKFSQVFFPVYNIKDFSKFSIPFRCVATDLATGKPVVHKGGELVKALRSSMAIPSVFSAVDHEKTKLVDGGIVRNFPATDAKEMGADIIIGVNLFLGLPQIEKLNTALDIMYQITQYVDAEDLVKEKRLCNVIIEPPVEDFSAGSFSSSDSIMQIGNYVGQVYYPYFKKLADSLNARYPIIYNPEGRLPGLDSVKINSYEINGIQKTSRKMLVDKLNIREGKNYSAMDLNKAFRTAFSTRYYQKIYYTLDPIKEGEAKLKCELKENPMAALKLGLSYHSYTGAGIIANVTVRNLLFDKSRTMLKVQIGDNLRSTIQHKQAFGKKLNNYASLGLTYESLPLPIYDRINIKQQNYLYHINNFTIDLNYKRQFGTNAALTLGSSKINAKLYPDISATGSFKGNVNNFYSYVGYEYNTINRRFFPTSGIDFGIEIGYISGRKLDINFSQNDTTVNLETFPELISKINDPFYRLQSQFIKYTQLGSKLTLIKHLGLGAHMNFSTFLLDGFTLGGIQRVVPRQFVFAGLNEGQIVTSSYAGLNLGLQYKVYNELYLIARANAAYYGFSTREMAVDIDEAKGILGGGLSLGYNLSAMPMEFTAMYSPEVGIVYGHVRLGFLF
jgi:NTE family protein